MDKIVQYFKNVRSEMAKVSWPARDEVVGATLLVVVLSIVVSIYVYGCDKFLVYVLGFFLQTN